MNLERSQTFIDAYNQLTREERQQVDARLRLLAENPRHPSLRARKWNNDIWYARASRDLRLVYEVHEDYYFLIDVGHHDSERSL